MILLLTILPLSFGLPSICLIIGKIRPTFPFLEEASSIRSSAACSFSFTTASFESSLHLSSLEAPLEPCLVLIILNPTDPTAWRDKVSFSSHPTDYYESTDILIYFKEPFYAICFDLDPVSFITNQVAFINHQEYLSATMTRRSEERIVDGNLSRTKDLKETSRSSRSPTI